MQPIRFLHIPKTAGTTFSKILQAQYSGARHFHFSGSVKIDKENFESIPKAERDEIMLFLGHAPILTDMEYINQISTITFLRDPIERVKSFCQHVSEGKSSYLLDKFPPDKFSLDNFLKGAILETRNLQTKMLVNKGPSAAPMTSPPKDNLEKALDNLFNNISAFGLLERFDESILYFQKMFNWQSPYYQKLNKKNPNRLLTFEDRHIEQIKELNILDIKLYEAAKIEFEKQIENTVSLKEVSQFKKRNHHLPHGLNLMNKLKGWIRLNKKKN